MPEADWSAGYVVDLDYTHGFYRELTPALLRFVALLGGVEAVDVTRPSRCVELGCGNGYTTALLAAANPHMRFTGVDFNPAHVHNARRLADAAGLVNVEFLEQSFEELAAQPAPEPADLVVLHGVYSWVSARNREHIVEYLRRCLRPAGLAYVSYNALPGMAPVVPLQRLLHDHASLSAGPLPERMRASAEFAARLAQAGGGFFAANPPALARLQGFARHDPAYLAHEYYNEHWMPFHFADVARDLGAAKLSYAASATLVDNFDALVLRPEQAQLVASQADRAFAEMVRDFLRNQQFRRDVYVRGAPKAPPARLESLLGGMRFALARPRPGCRLVLAQPAGEVRLHEDIHAPVLDALARSPMTFDALAAAPEVGGLDRTQVRKALFAMAALGNVLPALPEADEDERRASTAAFNRAALERASADPGNACLASPVLGTGVALTFLDRALLAAGGDVAAGIEAGCRAVAAAGLELRHQGNPVQGEQALREAVRGRATMFHAELLPWLAQVGIA